MNAEHAINRHLDVLRRRLTDAEAGSRPAPGTPKSGAAVLVPLFPSEGDLHVIYIRRADNVGSHQGQVAFPGGRVQANDANLLAAALREAHEEVGIHPATVDVLGALAAMRTNAINMMVTPFVGLLSGPPSLRADPSEVAEIFHVPLSALRDPRYRGYYKWSPNGAFTSEHPAILYEGQVIWGLTFRFTQSLLEVLDGSPGASR